jgi:hypothetical protein
MLRIKKMSFEVIQASDIHYTNRRRIREGLAPFKPLYTVEDVKDEVKKAVD